MTNEKKPCATPEEIQKIVTESINGGTRYSVFEWARLLGVCLTFLVVGVGAIQYLLKSEIGKAQSGVQQSIRLHEGLPWHPFAGRAHQQTTERLNRIDQNLARQTAILERVERAVEKQ